MEEKKEHVSDWLEKLQRESWNLELLVSGFSIFLLIQANEGIIQAFEYLNLHVELSGNVNGMVRTLLGILLLASIILTINLIVHVFLRGFWIGAVGLRSVQDKIDLEKLGYSEYFTEKLKTRVPSLDRMLEKLDTLSSVIFSFTFLIVFMLFSMFLYFSCISLYAYLVNLFLDTLEDDNVLKEVLQMSTVIVFVVMLIMGLVYAIDTLTVGFLKKYNWTSRLFFPIYKIIGWITLAKIYRSIYYSLVSRFSKGVIRLGLAVYLLLFTFLPFFKFDQYIYYPDNNDNKGRLFNINYDDLREEDRYIWNASIPTQIVKSSFLPLFIRYRVADNEALKKVCPDFQPLKKEGLNSGINIGSEGINLSDPYIEEDSPEKALECFSDFYRVQIDSTMIETDFYFYTNPNEGEIGVQTMLDLKNLPRGKHIIKVTKKRVNRDEELKDRDYETIVFWKE